MILFDNLAKTSNLSEAAKNVGEHLKSLRSSKGITIQKLAEETGISAKSISLIENSIHNPSLQSVYKITQALDVSLMEFFQFMTTKQIPIRTAVLKEKNHCEIFETHLANLSLQELSFILDIGNIIKQHDFEAMTDDTTPKDS